MRVLMAEGTSDIIALEASVSGEKNGKLDLYKIATQFAQFMDVDTAKDVSFVCLNRRLILPLSLY